MKHPIQAIMLAAALLPAAAAGAGIQRVRLDATYLAAGESARGAVVLAEADKLPAGAVVRVTLVREVDVPGGPGSKPGRRVEMLAERALAGLTGQGEVPFQIDTAGMLFGTVQVKAELLPASAAAAVSTAWTEPVEVGLRRRVDLAGDWEVVSAKELGIEIRGRPKGWQAPPAPKTIRLPGSLDDTPLTEHFRGWVTLRRRAAWPSEGGLSPRTLCATGVSDSLAATIDSKPVGEVLPEADLEDFLSHWPYYHGSRLHSGVKGRPDEKRLIRLLKDVDLQPPQCWPLPPGLGAGGAATIELALRGTSGTYRSKPPYGILGELYLQLAPDVHIQAVTLDTSKPGPMRRITFRVVLANESAKPFTGRLRTVFGRYQGRWAYTGPCPQYAEQAQAVRVEPGEHAIEVVRDEEPRFATCRATFLLEGAGKPLDALSADFHTATVEIRDRRDLYLNNERFIMKGRGSSDADANRRWQLLVNGVNTLRGIREAPSRRFPRLYSEAESVDDRLADGLLQDAGPLLASCERCTFWNPDDTSNVTRAVRSAVRRLARCPGIIQWEAFNELFGETEQVRQTVTRLFHELDPYHRPVMMTKSAGEWEAEARDGRAGGTDIVGIQYLMTPEAVGSITSAITEQPILSSEINWNDEGIIKNDLWRRWLQAGLCGALLFDYSGNSTDQGVGLLAVEDRERDGAFIRQANRQMYQDLTASAARQADGGVLLTLGNRMPYVLRNLTVRLRGLGQVSLPDLSAGDATEIAVRPWTDRHLPAWVQYTTHGGLPHATILAPEIAEPKGAKP